MLFCCDNAAVVAIVRSGSCKDSVAMQLLRNLFFFVAKFNVNIRIEHLPGAMNGAADALSRNKSSLFFSQVQSAQLLPTPIPRELLQLLVVEMLDWTSKTWTVLWRDTLRKV